MAAVADGMGGHEGGRIASRITVTESMSCVLDMTRWFLKLSPDTEDEFTDELADCLRSMHQKIWQTGGPDVPRMGTTLTMASLLWPRMFVVHAGDTRWNLYRDKKLRQLTTDHTVAHQLLDGGDV